MRRRSLTALACAMVLSACTVPTAKVTPQATSSTGPAGPAATPWAVLSSGPTTGGAARAAVQTGVTVSGAVKVPAGIVAAGGMNLVAAGGGNVIGPNGGNIVAAGGMNYVLLALEEEAAAGADVFLADAAGNPIPGLEKVKTNDKGEFTIPNVPADFTFVVAAEVQTKDGKKATFQTLAKPGKLGATAVVDAATTLVASNVLEGQKGADLGEFNPAVFKTAAETTAKNLAKDKLPDFSDRASVRAKMAELVEAVAELKESVSQLRTELSEVKKTLEDLRAALAKANEQPAPGGELPPPTTQPGTSPSPTQDPRQPGMSPPPPGTSPAPGMSPPPGGEACRPVGHQFVLPNKAEAERVVTIEFKIPSPDKPRDQWMNAATAKRENGFWADVPEGCPHLVMLKDASGALVVSIPDFRIAVGAAPQVELAPPTAGTSSPLPTTSPAPTGTRPPSTSPAPTQPPPSGSPPPGSTACTAPVTHRFRTTPGGAALKFYPPGGSQPVATAQAGSDGTFELRIPEGCAHIVKVYDASGRALAGLQSYSVPVGAQTDITLTLQTLP